MQPGARFSGPGPQPENVYNAMKSAAAPKPKQAPNAQFQRFVGWAHSFGMLIVLMPPFVLSMYIGWNTDVRYFNGTYMLAGFFVILWLPLTHYSHHFFKWSNGMFLASLICPLIFFAILGGFMRHDCEMVLDALKSSDCTSFVEKRELYEAYQDALGIYNHCGQYTTVGISNIEECPQYHDVEENYEKEFKYLHGLEQRFPCAGVCTEGNLRLWEGAGMEAPECDLYVVEWMWGAKIQSTAVLGYCVFMLVISAPIYMQIQPFLNKYYQGSEQPAHL
eukprot:gnl/TRDRNA2_/TRDRNA2_183418_c0_seq1.p1 gnl/TRDRNA2_/TRDRNA2_183418_c0~~gnl/TRDRNA2_/TRDRNA2_183418_c0_seq1.p1  ORF type:complete len:277 (+),score=49.56 gnl/TRDRNA2_/TRDRNA2_183418_c0_seq1:76-906(+)